MRQEKKKVHNIAKAARKTLALSASAPAFRPSAVIATALAGRPPRRAILLLGQRSHTLSQAERGSAPLSHERAQHRETSRPSASSRHHRTKCSLLMPPRVLTLPDGMTKQTCDLWNASEQEQSSNWKELTAACRTFFSFKKLIYPLPSRATPLR